MTSNIQKCIISAIEGENDRNGDKTAARVVPATADGVVSRPLTIPWWLRGKMGNLQVGNEVACAIFEDGTGLILSRMDGEWDGNVPGDVQVLKGSVTIDEGDLTAKTGNVNAPAGDVKASGISLVHHTHPANGAGPT